VQGVTIIVKAEGEGRCRMPCGGLEAR